MFHIVYSVRATQAAQRAVNVCCPVSVPYGIRRWLHNGPETNVVSQRRPPDVANSCFWSATRPLQQNGRVLITERTSWDYSSCHAEILRSIKWPHEVARVQHRALPSQLPAERGSIVDENMQTWVLLYALPTDWPGQMFATFLRKCSGARCAQNRKKQQSNCTKNHSVVGFEDGSLFTCFRSSRWDLCIYGQVLLDWRMRPRLSSKDWWVGWKCRNGKWRTKQNNRMNNLYANACRVTTKSQTSARITLSKSMQVKVNQVRGFITAS